MSSEVDANLDYWMSLGAELSRTPRAGTSAASLRSLADSLSFPEKFEFAIRNSSADSLTLLIQLEMHMRNEMLTKTRARNWEVDELARKCEQAMLEEHGAQEQRRFNELNDRLKQVHSAYSVQIKELAEKHRVAFRLAVDSLHSHNSIPASLIDEMHNETGRAIRAKTVDVSQAPDVDESYTVYIGSQLKSMHNIRLQSTPSLVDLCKLNNSEEEQSSRLQMAMSMYSRSLSAVILLVAKDPLFHARHNTEFFKLCEQSTELHFDSLEQQLEDNAESTRKANLWRMGNEGQAEEETKNASDSLEIGDVYCTKHSNLHNIQVQYRSISKRILIFQVAFHLVVDDILRTSDIQSRNPCLNGIRNIVRLSARLGITTLYIPLLLIGQPSEATTVAWCLKRAEMMFKCVKGFLIEVSIRHLINNEKLKLILSHTSSQYFQTQFYL
ncbi:hypothetical protein WR25_25481 isoform M [Diploscapter pachys]|uniref:Uncharacterized protein n=1 Tax=Diploscapter pachys TaxID=2018661 RepID=A0A2A2KUK3_9BILA|nr:hypothetical protein WR25_25481 isoform M [Diploscapter pachys]